MKILCKKNCYRRDDKNVLCFKEGVSYDVLREEDGDYELLDETGEEHLISNEVDDMFLDTYFSIIEAKITKIPTSYNLLSPNFEIQIYKDECYLKPYLADSMEFSIGYDDIDELIEVLQTAKETRNSM